MNKTGPEHGSVWITQISWLVIGGIALAAGVSQLLSWFR